MPIVAPPAELKRAFVGAGVDSSSHAAGDDDASIGEVAAQALGHLIPVRGRTTRADDGD